MYDAPSLSILDPSYLTITVSRKATLWHMYEIHLVLLYLYSDTVHGTTLHKTLLSTTTITLLQKPNITSDGVLSRCSGLRVTGHR